MSQSTFTRCPECGTVFRVTEQHLKIAQGKVRCGACLNVFVATNYLVKPKQTSSEKLTEKSSSKDSELPNQQLSQTTSPAPKQTQVARQETANSESISNAPIHDMFADPAEHSFEPEAAKTDHQESADKLASREDEQKSVNLDTDDVSNHTRDELASESGHRAELNEADTDSERDLIDDFADFYEEDVDSQIESDFGDLSDHDSLEHSTLEQSNLTNSNLDQANPNDDTPNTAPENQKQFNQPASTSSSPFVKESPFDAPDPGDWLIEDGGSDNEPESSHELDADSDSLVFDDSQIDENSIHDNQDALRVETSTGKQPKGSPEYDFDDDLNDDIELSEQPLPEPSDEDDHNLFDESSFDEDSFTGDAFANESFDEGAFDEEPFAEKGYRNDQIEETLSELPEDQAAQSSDKSSKPKTQSPRTPSASEFSRGPKTDDTFLEDDPTFEDDFSIDRLNQSLTSDTLEPDPLDEFDDMVQRKSHKWKWLSGTGVVLLALFWGISTLWTDRQTLAWDDTWGGLVHSMCTIAPCELKERRDLNAIELLQRDIRPADENPDITEFNLYIRNNADFEQPYPTVEIAFTDTRGEVVSTEVHTPDEYLSEDTRKTKMPIGQKTLILIRAKQAYANAFGFEFDFK